MIDLTRYADRATVQLTTIGRKSGQPRTVTVWFVVADRRRIHVQHSSRAPAQWYRNLLVSPAVKLDFGDGPMEARARAVTDPAEIEAILRRVRRKYRMAWLFRLLGWGRKPQVAAIEAVGDAG